jgi:RNA 2',3'-cyclic 3'-phosphodiesterase
MRLFVALTFEDDLLDAIEAVQGRIPAGRVVPRENLHLTLLFAGELDERGAEALHDGLDGVGFDAFPLQLAGLGTFGSPWPETLWLGAAANPALEALQGKVRAAAHGAGVMPERQRFRPHVTLARLGGTCGDGDAARLAAFLSRWGSLVPPIAQVRGFALMQSQLRRDGARYEELARYGARGWQAGWPGNGLAL